MKVVSIRSKLPIVENHQEESCGENEIIIKLKACGICGSDIPQSAELFIKIYNVFPIIF